jgi:indole-3-glycerol phosphate synthase
MAVLDQILDGIRAGLPGRRAHRAALEARVAGLPPAPDFVAAFRRPNVALIAEVKRKSPSAGAINVGLDPVELSSAYAAGGAAAISVLTEGPHFGGSLDDLHAVGAAVAVPVLRKDFILDEIQLLEARAAGAAAALLIVRALSDTDLRRLDAFASAIGLATLVEAHDRAELDRALAAGCRVVGVNARDLDDFSMHRAAAWELLATVPTDRVAVAESGMHTAEDVAEAARHGADAVLIGGALASAGDPRAGALAMSGVRRRGR